MSCYHPLKGFVLGVRPDGKKIIKIIKSEKLDFVNRSEYVDVIEIPCGHCIGCRLDYSREWANRCMLELEDHQHASFLTLTYDDEHLPVSNSIITTSGYIAASPIHPLVKRDLQNFWKRLRKAYPDTKIRYFACGEYGDNTFRPHYHAVCFGVDFHEDREVIKKDSEFTYYISNTLSKLWPFGFHLIADVNWNTCAYCARYVTKKLVGNDAEFYKNYNIPSPFACMSRRPGIGRKYYDEHLKDIYNNDEIFLTMRDGGKRIQPPRYFDRCLELDDPELFDNIKDRRRIKQETSSVLIPSYTDKSYLDYLATKEHNKIDVIKSLSRKEV